MSEGVWSPSLSLSFRTPERARPGRPGAAHRRALWIPCLCFSVSKILSRLSWSSITSGGCSDHQRSGSAEEESQLCVCVCVCVCVRSGSAEEEPQLCVCVCVCVNTV